MELRGVTRECDRLWANGATALIGISPFNSYFSAERIRAIIEFCERGGRPVALFVPDDVTRYTLQARGYSEEEAVRKTRRQIRYLRNKIDQAIQTRGLPVFDCRTLESNSAYRERLAATLGRFKDDDPFRRACLETTRWVLSAKEDEPVAPEAAMLGVNYLLAELPLFFNSPDILGESQVVFIYHQCPSMVVGAYEDRARSRISPGQGFGVLRTPAFEASTAGL
jgi:cyclo(L-tyrosyl-L-tyrosyl) synthase